MAISEIKEFLKIVPAVRKAPFKYLWSSSRRRSRRPLHQLQKAEPRHRQRNYRRRHRRAIRERRCCRFDHPARQQTLSRSPNRAPSQRFEAVQAKTERIKRRLRRRCKIAERTASHQSRRRSLGHRGCERREIGGARTARLTLIRHNAQQQSIAAPSPATSYPRVEVSNLACPVPLK